MRMQKYLHCVILKRHSTNRPSNGDNAKCKTRAAKRLLVGFLSVMELIGQVQVLVRPSPDHIYMDMGPLSWPKNRYPVHVEPVPLLKFNSPTMKLNS